MRFNIEKLAEVAKPATRKSLEEAAGRKANEDWLRLSQEIALNVHCYLRDRKMTRTTLAKAMNVSPAYIAKLLKGNENLTLETICKIEKIIGRKLIYTSRTYRRYSTSGLPNSYLSEPQADYGKQEEGDSGLNPFLTEAEY